MAKKALARSQPSNHAPPKAQTVAVAPPKIPKFSPLPGIEEETDALNFSMYESGNASIGVRNGSIDAAKGNSINRNATTIIKAAEKRMDFRLSRAKLIAQEAKDITLPAA